MTRRRFHRTTEVTPRSKSPFAFQTCKVTKKKQGRKGCARGTTRYFLRSFPSHGPPLVPETGRWSGPRPNPWNWTVTTLDINLKGLPRVLHGLTANFKGHRTKWTFPNHYFGRRLLWMTSFSSQEKVGGAEMTRILSTIILEFLRSPNPTPWRVGGG